jgi:uroporphyrinogen-III synthase
MKGKIIVTTQPADQASTMLELLREKGAVAIHLPVIETRTLTLSSRQIQEISSDIPFDLVIFTSRKGVKGFFENLFRVNGNYLLPQALQIAAVGEKTASELSMYNHQASWINPGKDASDLVKNIPSLMDITGKNILLALGNRAPDFLENALGSSAKYIMRVNVYETLDITPSPESMQEAKKPGRVDMCIFTSPSGFYSFLRYFSELNILNLAAIGNTTAAAITHSGYVASVISTMPAAEAMVNDIESFFSNQQK